MASIREVMDFRFNETKLVGRTLIHKDSEFKIENIEEPEIFNLNQIVVKRFCDLITSGIALSISSEIRVGEMYPVIKQSLYNPLTLDIMLRVIAMQENINRPNKYGFGCLFLGTKLRHVRVLDIKSLYAKRFTEGAVYYPELDFEDVTRAKGYYHVSLVSEDYMASKPNLAVCI